MSISDAAQWRVAVDDAVAAVEPVLSALVDDAVFSGAQQAIDGAPIDRNVHVAVRRALALPAAKALRAAFADLAVAAPVDERRASPDPSVGALLRSLELPVVATRDYDGQTVWGERLRRAREAFAPIEEAAAARVADRDSWKRARSTREPARMAARFVAAPRGFGHGNDPTGIAAGFGVRAGMLAQWVGRADASIQTETATELRAAVMEIGRALVGAHAARLATVAIKDETREAIERQAQLRTDLRARAAREGTTLGPADGEVVRVATDVFGAEPQDAAGRAAWREGVGLLKLAAAVGWDPEYDPIPEALVPSVLENRTRAEQARRTEFDSARLGPGRQTPAGRQIAEAARPRALQSGIER